MRALMTVDRDGEMTLWPIDTDRDDLELVDNDNWAALHATPLYDIDQQTLIESFPDLPPGSGPVEVEITVTEVVK